LKAMVGSVAWDLGLIRLAGTGPFGYAQGKLSRRLRLREHSCVEWLRLEKSQAWRF